MHDRDGARLVEPPALWGAALTCCCSEKMPTTSSATRQRSSKRVNSRPRAGHAATGGRGAGVHRAAPAQLPLHRSQARCALAASRMGEAGFDLFRTASGSRDASTRQAVFVVVNAVYQRDPQTVLAILHHLLDDIGLKVLVTASARLQTALRVLGLFTRYGLANNLVDEADKLIHTVTVKNLYLPAEKGRVGRALVQRLLSINTTSWPADRNAVQAIARAGSLTETEEAAYRRVLEILKMRADGLDKISTDDLQILLACQSDAVRFLAHHQLCLWLNLRQEGALSAIQSLFDSSNDLRSSLAVDGLPAVECPAP